METKFLKLNMTTVSVAAMGLVMAGATPALAADAAETSPTAQDATQVEVITVTARKRSEDLLKVPIVVSALTGNDLEQRSIKSLSDVANFTPGLADSQSAGGSARSDRSFQSLIIRGLNPSSTDRPTTSVFINGAPVAAPDFVQNLTDVERVEVLKGPQSAYFGRQTFAGAINVIAKMPTSAFGVVASASAGTRNSYNLDATVNLPIVTDKLAVRVGYAYDAHDGSYRNTYNPAETLGNQKTQTFHAALIAKPIENLTIKAFGMMFSNDDGAPATGIYLGGSAKSQSNCTVNGLAFFCGVLPQLNSSISPAQVTTISNTVNFTNVSTAFIQNPGGILGPNDLVQGFGLKRKAYHADWDVEYVIPGIDATLTYLGAVNNSKWSTLSDLGNINGTAAGQYPGYNGFPFEVQRSQHDQSHEVRITTDTTKRFRVMVGASYVRAYLNNGLGVAAFGPGTVAPTGASRSSTKGVFFSLAYDILPKLTLNVDGRYLADSQTAYTTANVVTAQATSKDFVPRVTLEYKFMPGGMTYFTYSKGINPGVFNTQFTAIPAPSQAKLVSLGISGGIVVKPERLTNYEWGVKGRFLNGRATLAADVYYAKWKDQMSPNQYLFAANDPASPYNVVGSATYVAGNTSAYLYSYIDNSAESTAKGIEAEATLIPVRHVTVNLSGALNDTKYDAYTCIGGCAPYASFNAAGKRLPNAPQFSSAVGVQYDNDLPFLNDAKWFGRVDFIYRDGVYIQASNTVRTPNVSYVNLHAGVTYDRFSIQGYVTNLFNNRSPVSGFQGFDFAGGFAPNAIMVGLPQLITAGIKISVKY